MTVFDLNPQSQLLLNRFEVLTPGVSPDYLQVGNDEQISRKISLISEDNVFVTLNFTVMGKSSRLGLGRRSLPFSVKVYLEITLIRPYRRKDRSDSQ